jgi:hypothetical protein
MTGAGNAIDPDALLLFAGKRVRIAFHAEESGAGREAAHKWKNQLYKAGAAFVDGFDFSGITLSDGRPCKDLADFATLLDPEDPPSERVFCNLAENGETPNQ